ncbi:MAG: hypothetical protein R3E83_11560 [Burkholderiaceae bacterium]
MRSLLRDRAAADPRRARFARRGDALLTTTQIRTYDGQLLLTGASGFFFLAAMNACTWSSTGMCSLRPAEAIFLTVEIELHSDEHDLTQHVVFSIPLYRDGLGLWRQAADSEGTVDIAVIELERERLPGSGAAGLRAGASPTRGRVSG